MGPLFSVPDLSKGQKPRQSGGQSRPVAFVDRLSLELPDNWAELGPAVLLKEQTPGCNHVSSLTPEVPVSWPRPDRGHFACSSGGV